MSIGDTGQHNSGVKIFHTLEFELAVACLTKYIIAYVQANCAMFSHLAEQLQIVISNCGSNTLQVHIYIIKSWKGLNADIANF